jgi:predicted N-acetyltransferase YhbS
MAFTFRTDVTPDVDSIVAVFESSGIHRPTSDRDRIQQMFARADLVVTAWEDAMLVGLARTLTDFCYCAYLSDLAVRREYQHRGIGKRLISLTQEKAGPQATLILVASASARDYYPRVGMVQTDRCFLHPRTR